MKATVELDDALYRELKAAAALRGRKIKELVAEGVQTVLRDLTMTSPRHRIRVPVIRSGRPGTLDIPEDVAARLDLVEDRKRHAASVRR